MKNLYRTVFGSGEYYAMTRKISIKEAKIYFDIRRVSEKEVDYYFG